MNEKLIIIFGVWIFADGIFSLYTYWSKEGIKENSIRIIRLILGGCLIYMGFI